MPAVPPGPLDLGGILSGTFRILRRKLGLYALLALIPGFILAIVLAAAMIPVILAVIDIAQGRGAPALGWAVGAGVVAFAALVVGILAQVKCEGMMSLAAHDLAHGGAPESRGLWSRTRGLVPRVLLFYVVVSLATTVLIGAFVALIVGLVNAAQNSESVVAAAGIVGFLLFVGVYVAAIFLSVRLLYFLPVLAIEGATAWDALKRSWNLTRGNFWRTLGYYLVASAIASTVAFLLSWLSQLLMMPIMIAGAASGSEDSASTAATLAMLPAIALVSGLQIVLTMLVVPFSVIFTTAMYIDQVRRSEMGYRAGAYGPPGNGPYSPPPYGPPSYDPPPYDPPPYGPPIYGPSPYGPPPPGQPPTGWPR